AQIRQLFQEPGAFTQTEDRMELLCCLGRIVPYLTPRELATIWKKLDSLPGSRTFSVQERTLVQMIKAAGNRDAKAMSIAANAVLANKSILSHDSLEYALAGGMLGS